MLSRVRDWKRQHIGYISPSEWADWQWEKIWLCRVRNRHMVKFSSDGRCVRCGR